MTWCSGKNHNYRNKKGIVNIVFLIIIQIPFSGYLIEILCLIKSEILWFFFSFRGVISVSKIIISSIAGGEGKIEGEVKIHFGGYLTPKCSHSTKEYFVNRCY